MKAADPRSRVVSVAGKDRAALMLGGHAIDQVWFWNGKSYVTLQGVAPAAPAIIAQVNAAVAATMEKPDIPALPEPCRSRSSALAVGDRNVGVLHERKAGDWPAFRTSLAFDRATTDIAIGLIRELHLGSGDAPDMLAIGLSATDYVGHMFGTEGAEMCAQLLGVDDNVGRILAALDATRRPYIVVLTADHGGHDLPERIKMRGIPDAARVDAALLPANMSKQLAAEFGLPDPVLLGVAPFGDIYLARTVPDSLRSRVLAAAKAHAGCRLRRDRWMNGHWQSGSVPASIRIDRAICSWHQSRISPPSSVSAATWPHTVRRGTTIAGCRSSSTNRKFQASNSRCPLRLSTSCPPWPH
jgi:alkaline phosphatase